MTVSDGQSVGGIIYKKKIIIIIIIIIQRKIAAENVTDSRGETSPHNLRE
jgi:hypothetical protein